MNKHYTMGDDWVALVDKPASDYVKVLRSDLLRLSDTVDSMSDQHNCGILDDVARELLVLAK